MYTPQETRADTGEPQKRAASSEAEAPRRLKRGKYTPIACEECKKRKLKCQPADNGGDCQRCASSGIVCGYRAVPSRLDRDRVDNPSIRAIYHEIKQLSDLVNGLTGTIADLRNRLGNNDAVSPSQSLAATSSTAARYDGSPRAGRQHRAASPKEPQFVGPTRSAYSFELGKRSLTDMGIPQFDLPPPSRPQSAAGSPKAAPVQPDFWKRCTASEVVRLLEVFEEEIESVYPCIDSQVLGISAAQILEYGRLEERGCEVVGPTGKGRAFGLKDFQVAKVAIAIAIVIEGHGSNEDSEMLVEPVKDKVSWMRHVEVDLKDIQLLATLGIYYFHCDEDLLAWRTIGVAARGALEMGLHRKESLEKMFGDRSTRSVATRVFWCVYVLDRRWSFGTSLSFALVDRDIDPELPEPGSEHEYLQCMVGYGRLSSKLWDALMSFGTSPNEERDTSLDFLTQEWIESIPAHLRLRHPRLGMGSRTQPRVLHRLRAMLYLRGNHTRILIYRHHLLSASSINADLRSAWLVVEIARDSVQVLVHLNTTSDIYSRQQNAFNYFLLSALAVIFLAVCHQPAVFAEPCREAFQAAVELVKGFSHHSKVSRRLWDSIRGLVPRLRRLVMRGADERPRQIEASSQQSGVVMVSPSEANGSTESIYNDRLIPASGYAPNLNQQYLSNHGAPGLGTQLPLYSSQGSNDDQGELTPTMFELSNDLMTLFNVFDQNQQLPDDVRPWINPGSDTLFHEDGEVWRRFEGLI